MGETPTVAVFRPDDDRLEQAIAFLEDRGVEPIPDPMLAVEATDAVPRTDADYIVFTSKTGAELISEAGWEQGDEFVWAIGPAAAAAPPFSSLGSPPASEMSSAPVLLVKTM